MHIKDVSFVYDLEKATFGDSLEKPMLYNEILYNDMAHYFVITEYQKRVGYVGLWLTQPNAEILNLAVIEDKQKQGYGKALLEKAVSVCKENDIDTITLEVRKSHKQIIDFYTSFGFKVVGERKRYYKNHEDAYLMAKDVKT